MLLPKFTKVLYKNMKPPQSYRIMLDEYQRLCKETS